MVDLASTAISNTVPAGFAFGLGTTAAMFHSFGFPPAPSPGRIALTGIWNNLVKLAMPALALGRPVVVGHAPPGLAVAAVLGSAILLVVVGALVATVTPGVRGRGWPRQPRDSRREPLARAAAPSPPAGWRGPSVPADSLQPLRHRWVPLTVAAVASHVPCSWSCSPVCARSTATVRRLLGRRAGGLLPHPAGHPAADHAGRPRRRRAELRRRSHGGRRVPARRPPPCSCSGSSPGSCRSRSGGRVAVWRRGVGRVPTTAEPARAAA